MDKRLLKEYLFLAIEYTSDWVILTDIDGVIMYANNAVEVISGYKKEEILGQKPSIFKSGLYTRADYEKLWNTILSGQVYKKALINKKKDGTFFQILHTILPIKQDGKVVKFLSIAKDISREMDLLDEIKKFKYQDTSTSLLNRAGFIYEISRSIKDYKNIEIGMAIIVIDIVNFSHFNEVYGISVCNDLLKLFGKRLADRFGGDSIVARIGGDVFAIFNIFLNINELKNMITEIIHVCKSPFSIENVNEIVFDIKIGVKVLQQSDISVEDSLHKAELALNLAKKNPNSIFRFYNDNINKEVTDFVNTYHLVKEAIDNRWFVFYFQPIYDTNSLKIVSLEVLVRIKHPTMGLIYPDKYINFLENSSFLADFERILFEKALNYMGRISDETGGNLNISINISVNSFRNGSIIDLCEKVSEELRRFISIEITERVFAERVDKIISILNKLKELGFVLEIDDFGTGYSSLSYIDKMQVDFLKINMSFVWRMIECKKTYAIVKSIIELAKGVGMKTIAEGVETKEQYDMLKSLGSDFVQGYYFSKPLPFDDILLKLKSNK
ncbi:putative bifunctional diguanylate cyclase/phosphodiesterase [Calditerrivibrio nitroreducens]|uniref:putative bifunctional diguanylate cyclase/phosphodiesterase n=1 Tax=Calditerrivibrio nitroreducens TaxID=477976 RepID=UPI003C71E14C